MILQRKQKLLHFPLAIFKKILNSNISDLPSNNLAMILSILSLSPSAICLSFAYSTLIILSVGRPKRSRWLTILILFQIFSAIVSFPASNWKWRPFVKPSALIDIYSGTAHWILGSVFLNFKMAANRCLKRWQSDVKTLDMHFQLSIKIPPYD